MIKYIKEWSYKDKSGVSYFLVDEGTTYKISENIFNALPASVVFIGSQVDYYDKEKERHNIYYTDAVKTDK